MTRGSAVALFFAVLLAASVTTVAHGQPGSKGESDLLSEEYLSSVRELRLNSGVTSLSSYAHAYYKLGIEERKAGNSARSIQALRTASELDPYFPDPHFSLFRAHLIRDPGRAFEELSAVSGILRRDFIAQYFLLKNAIVMAWMALLVSLALFTAFAAIRHVAMLKHVISERLAIEIPSRPAGWLGVVAVLQPVLWGLGVAGTVLCYSGALWRCMSRRERLLGLVFLALAVTAPFVSHGIASRLPPVGYHSPTYNSYAALRQGWTGELEGTLLRFLEAEPKNAAYHFAYGTMARRAGKLGIARNELTAAVRLSPKDPIYLNNLGNVYFNLGDAATAEEFYSEATKLDPSLPQPHYNLAQVFTRKLMFGRANEELVRANDLDSELISEFSINSREQLNRSVIDAEPTASSFWTSLAREKTAASPPDVLLGASGYLGIGAQQRSVAILVLFALSVLGGILAFRNLYTYRCANCGKVVCRKCLKRVHRTIFCEACGKTASSLQSDEFAKLLFSNQLRIETRKSMLISLPFRILVPGFILVERGDSIRGFFLLLLTSIALIYLYGQGYVVDYIPSLRYQQEHLLKYIAVIAPLLLLHVSVLLSYSRRPASQPVSLKLLKPEHDGTLVTNGATRKPGRFQSG